MKSIIYLNKANKKRAYSDNSLFLNADIHRLYGYDYQSIKLFYLAKRHYLKSIQLTKQVTKDTLRRNKFLRYDYFAITLMYASTGKMDSVLHYIEEFKNSTFIETKVGTGYMYTMYGSHKLYEGEIDSAFYYYHQAYRLLQNRNPTLYRAIALRGMGKAAYQKENYKESLDYFKKALKATNNIRFKVPVWYYIGNIYKQLGNEAKEEKYLKHRISIKDSLNHVYALQRAYLLSHVLDDSIVHQNKLIKKNEDSYLLWPWAIAVLCAAAIYGFYFSQKRKAKENRSTSIAKPKTQEGFRQVVQLAKDNDPALKSCFREFHPDVSDKLDSLEPALTKSECKFCIFIFLGFDSKDISRYTHIQPKSVQMKKYRLRKKYNLDKGKDLHDWIKEL